MRAWWLILLTLITVQPAPAEGGSWARLVTVEGEAVIKGNSSGPGEEAAPGRDLAPAERLVIANKGLVRLVLADGSLVWVGPKSELRLVDLKKEVARGDCTLTLALDQGLIQLIASDLETDLFCRLLVETPNCVVGVINDAAIIRAAPESSKVVGFNYPVQVTAKGDGTEPVVVQAARVVEVRSGGPASKSREMSEAEAEEFGRLLGPPLKSEPSEGKAASGMAPITVETTTTTTTTSTTTTDRSTFDPVD